MALSGITACSTCGTNDSQNQLRIDLQQRKQIQELKQRDAEVKNHEAAHLSAAGQYATGGASFQYVTGPDGKRYAVAGEVKIDTSKEDGDPQATIQKARAVRRAAMAPANPSAQDRAVAAQAAKMEFEAQVELSRMQSETPAGYDSTGRFENSTPEPALIDLILP